MPQKNHKKAASHRDEEAKHHKPATKQAAEENHEKAAHLAQTAQGHHKKANEHDGKAEGKNTEGAGSMKKENMEDESMDMEDNKRSKR